jgi:hypothetical protein
VSANPLPFGDPCSKCGAASTHADPRDRICVCDPCAACGTPTLSTCAYCGQSLGCNDHRVSIERHVETYCLATAEQRALVDAGMSLEAREQLVAEIRASIPLPWPAPVGPFEPVAVAIRVRP